MIMVLCHIVYLHRVFIAATKNNETKGNFVPHLIMPSERGSASSLSTNAVSVDPLSLPLTVKHRVKTFSLECGGVINWTSLVIRDCVEAGGGLVSLVTQY